MGTTTLSKKKQITLDDLAALHLGTGAGSRDGELCAMTAAAWLAGRTHSDSPPCVASSIRRLIISLNDRAPDGPRQRLKEIIPDILGSAERGNAWTRAYAFADLARLIAAEAIEVVGRKEDADLLRSQPTIIDAKTSANARKVSAEIKVKLKAAAAAADAYAAAAADAKAREKMWNRIMDIAIPAIRKIAA